MEVSVWVPIIVAAIAVVPGLLAWAATNKQRASDARAQVAMAGVEGERVDVERDKSAIEGFVRLVEHLQTQIDGERKMNDECRLKLAALQDRMDHIEGTG